MKMEANRLSWSVIVRESCHSKAPQKQILGSGVWFKVIVSGACRGFSLCFVWVKVPFLFSITLVISVLPKESHRCWESGPEPHKQGHQL